MHVCTLLELSGVAALSWQLARRSAGRWEETAAVMELTHTHVHCKHTQVHKIHGADTSTQMHCHGEQYTHTSSCAVTM